MARQSFVNRLVSDLSLSQSTPFSKLLASCIVSKSSPSSRTVHARILKTIFSSDVFIQNRLIEAYGKCGSLDYARKVFDQMPQRNVFSWNSLLSALARFGFLDEAVKVFWAMPEPDRCSWNSLVSGFSQFGRFDEALGYFVLMHREGLVFDEYSFGSVLSVCAGRCDLELGAQIHGLISKSTCSLDVYTGSALIDMYSKCGNVDCARRVFDGMDERNIVSWNSLITGYEQNGSPCMALDVFVRMTGFRIEPNEVTLASVLSACAGVFGIKNGQQIHARVIKDDKLRDDVVISNALVVMYVKSRRIREARLVFDKTRVRNARKIMSDRNVASWNSLIAGYTQNGDNKEAIRLYVLMQRESGCPTHYTFGNLLNACTVLLDINLGRQVHTHVLKHGCEFQSKEESDTFVGNSLIDMYAKCGSVENGWQAFDTMTQRDRVSWNAMILEYAQNGHGHKALALFNKMLASREKPDHVTMIGVLCACSYTGLVMAGRHHFHTMTEKHRLFPLKDHYACIVDLLGRAGRLDEAKNLIEAMPMKPDAIVWLSLLSACKVHGNVTIGSYVALKLIEIDPESSGPYVILSNMYADVGRWEDAARVRKVMRERGVVKQPGCSWTEVQGRMHVFLAKDRWRPQRKEIFVFLKLLTEEMSIAGYDDGFETQSGLEFVDVSAETVAG